MTITIGRPTSRTAPNTEVSHVPRRGLRHVLGSAGGGTGIRPRARKNDLGKPYSGSGAARGSGPGPASGGSVGRTVVMTGP